MVMILALIQIPQDTQDKSEVHWLGGYARKPSNHTDG